MGEKEIRDFLVYLRDVKKRHPSTIKTYVAALKFFYTNTLGRPEVVRPWMTPAVPRKLPKILTGPEVEALLGAVRSIRYRAILMTTYGAGLRVGEVCRLRVEDVDSERMLLYIRETKGGRDRYAMLSSRLLEVLRAYWKHERPPKPYLFPGNEPGTFVSPKSIRTVMRKAVEDSGIGRPVTPHILRHAFATHLLDAGTDIRTIQVLLGHRSICTTQIYTQVSPRHIGRVKSPLDLLGTEEAKDLG
jgi:site-specific recombinase XerD